MVDLKGRGAIDPGVLRTYGGAPHGEDAEGIMDIEFESLYRACLWAIACEITEHVYIRDEYRDRAFSERTVVQVNVQYL